MSSCSGGSVRKLYSDLPLVRERRALCISYVLGQQVMFETGRTLVVTQFTSTVNAYSFVLVKRTVWQGFEAELAIQNPLFFIISAQEEADMGGISAARAGRGS